MPERYFIIGDPVSHSISPCIHNALFKHYGIDARYEALRVTADELSEFFHSLRDTYRGGNVTIPHKVAAIAFMNELGEEAIHTGAINTVTLDADGALRGNNTDVSGFVYSLERELGGPIPEPVGIIGAGGAARGVLYGLITQGLKEYVLVNRTRTKAEALLEDFSSLSRGLDITVCKLEGGAYEKALARVNLIVNASALGLREDFKEFPFERLKKKTTLVDIVYKKGNTYLVNEGMKRGFTCIDALPMLAAQAAFAFRHWTKILPDYTMVKKIATNCLEIA
ncbi:MAG: shikimate dehydrogenase [Deltaproteobacteria bacterium]|nr:shikimate dehydrogenase [Deltaproteobacteria bacterium]NIS76383.1 shikimate dehydrogenase [Deltaproteobacteria bacterium]